MSLDVTESDDVRGLSRYFVDETSTMSMEFSNGSLVLRTKDPNHCFQRLNDNGVALRHQLEGCGSYARDLFIDYPSR